MAEYEVMAVSVGEPQAVPYHNTVVETAFIKQPISEPVYLSSFNFEGDRQADQKNHGGRDKALLGYCFDHFSYWKEQTGMTFQPSAFGENITVKGLTEEILCIGDIYQLDDAIVQVSQPRTPCYKIAARYGLKEMPLLVEQTGYTGFYFRVLKEGMVNPQPKLTLLEKGTEDMPIIKAHRIIHNKKASKEELEQLLYTPALATSLQAALKKKLG